MKLSKVQSYLTPLFILSFLFMNVSCKEMQKGLTKSAKKRDLTESSKVEYQQLETASSTSIGAIIPKVTPAVVTAEQEALNKAKGAFLVF